MWLWDCGLWGALDMGLEACVSLDFWPQVFKMDFFEKNSTGRDPGVSESWSHS